MCCYHKGPKQCCPVVQEQVHLPLPIKELKAREEELLEILGSPSRQFLVSLIKNFKADTRRLRIHDVLRGKLKDNFLAFQGENPGSGKL